MRQFFYQLWYEYEDAFGLHSFDLGVFANKKDACAKMLLSMKLPGFSSGSEENYSICKFGLNFEERPKEKNGLTIFNVTLGYSDCLYDYWYDYGYYSTYEKAVSVAKEVKEHTRIGKKYPNGVEINKVKVGFRDDAWCEGFKTIP